MMAQNQRISGSTMEDHRISFESFSLSNISSFTDSISPQGSGAPRSSSTAALTTNISNPSKTVQQRTFMYRITHLGWWWETGAIILSIVCTSLILAILFTMDGKPMRDWTLPIQPNSLVAVFSTVAKSALLVPLSECIGQLKWVYFDASRAKPLDRMQVFDDASRGPWGSLLFLCKIRLRTPALLASFGAIITILLLGFEPFAQQVLQVFSKSAPLQNMTGYVTSSMAFSDAYFIQNIDLVGVEYPLGVGMMDLIAEQPYSPLGHSYCPTSECQIGDFTSLGICASCASQNLVLDQDFSHNGEFDDSDFQGCGHLAYLKTPNGTEGPEHRFAFDSKAFRTFVKEYKPDSLSSWEKLCTFKSSGYPTLTLWITAEYFDNEWFPAVGDMEDDPIFGYDIGIWRLERNKDDKDFDVFTVGSGGPTYGADAKSRVEYCTGDYAGYELSGINFSSNFTTLSAFTCFRSSSDLTRINEENRLSDVNGTLSHCRLDFCAKRYHNVTIRNAVGYYEKVSHWPLQQLGDEYAKPTEFSGIDFAFRVDDLNTTFYIGNFTKLFFAAQIKRITRSDTISTFLPNFFLNNTWAQFFDGLASASTRVVQSPQNPDAINNTGVALGQDIFFHVRWLWFIPPMLLLGVTLLFLLLTASKNCKDTYLFKNSTIALLLHGIEERDIKNHQCLLSVKKETYRDLRDTAKQINVALGRNTDGCLKLKQD